MQKLCTAAGQIAHFYTIRPAQVALEMVRAGVSRPHVGLATGLVWTLTWVSIAWGDAQPGPTSLGRCLQAGYIKSALKPKAISAPSQTLFHGYLSERQSKSVKLMFAAAQCVDLVALAQESAQNMDLSVYDANGQALATAYDQPRFEFVRICLSAHQPVYVNMRMMQGEGAVQLAVFDQKDNAVRRLLNQIGECVGPLGDTLQNEPVDLEVHWPPHAGTPKKGQKAKVSGLLDQEHRDTLMAINQRLSEDGYAPHGMGLESSLEGKQVEGHALTLSSNRCYALAVVGDSSIRDMDALIRQKSLDNGEYQLLAADVSRERFALLKLCVHQDRDVILETHVYQGGGAYQVWLWSMPLSAIAMTHFAEEPAAWVGVSETDAHLRLRGLEPQVTGWIYMSGVGEWHLPVETHGGACFAVAALPSRSIAQGDLDLALTGPEGDWVGWDVGVTNRPMIYHCAGQPGKYSLSGHIYGAEGQALVIVGSTRKK